MHVFWKITIEIFLSCLLPTRRCAGVARIAVASSTMHTHTFTSLVLHSVLLCQSDLLLYLPLQILRLLVQHLFSIAQLFDGHLRWGTAVAFLPRSEQASERRRHRVLTILLLLGYAQFYSLLLRRMTWYQRGFWDSLKALNTIMFTAEDLPYPWRVNLVSTRRLACLSTSWPSHMMILRVSCAKFRGMLIA